MGGLTDGERVVVMVDVEWLGERAMVIRPATSVIKTARAMGSYAERQGLLSAGARKTMGDGKYDTQLNDAS